MGFDIGSLFSMLSSPAALGGMSVAQGFGQQGRQLLGTAGNALMYGNAMDYAQGAQQRSMDAFNTQYPYYQQGLADLRNYQASQFYSPTGAPPQPGGGRPQGPYDYSQAMGGVPPMYGTNMPPVQSPAAGYQGRQEDQGWYPGQAVGRNRPAFSPFGRMQQITGWGGPGSVLRGLIGEGAKARGHREQREGQAVPPTQWGQGGDWSGYQGGGAGGPAPTKMAGGGQTGDQFLRGLTAGTGGEQGGQARWAQQNPERAAQLKRQLAQGQMMRGQAMGLQDAAGQTQGGALGMLGQAGQGYGGGQGGAQQMKGGGQLPPWFERGGRRPDQQPGGTPGGAPGGGGAYDPWGIVTGYQDRFKTGMDRFNTQGQQLLGDLQGRYTTEMGRLEGLGTQAKADITRDYKALAGTGMQDLVSRGLSGTSMLPGMRMGVERERQGSLGRLGEQLRREEIGLSTQLSGDKLRAQQGLDQQRMQWGSGLQGDLLRALGSERAGQMGSYLGGRQAELGGMLGGMQAGTNLDLQTMAPILSILQNMNIGYGDPYAGMQGAASAGRGAGAQDYLSAMRNQQGGNWMGMGGSAAGSGMGIAGLMTGNPLLAGIGFGTGAASQYF